MSALVPAFDSIHLYVSDFASRVVSESGIASDKYHIGKLILQGLKDAPEFLGQTDAATGKSETFKVTLEKSVKCAAGLKKMGLKTGDVLVLMAPNHIDVTTVMYAAMYLGIAVATIDVSLGVYELKRMFKVNRANLIFCQTVKTTEVRQAINEIGLQTKIVTFDDGSQERSLSKLLEDCADVDVYKFKPEDFDPEETIATLTCTSGSTGIPKAAALTHKNLSIALPYTWSMSEDCPVPTRLLFLIAPLQWLSAIFFYLLSPILRISRIQTSGALTPTHLAQIINVYKPTTMSLNPTLMTAMMKQGVVEKMDFTCFEHIRLGGSLVRQQLIDQIKQIAPNVKVWARYGCTEAGCTIFSDHHQIPGSLGKPIGIFDYRLVNVDTNEDITESHVNGELYLRGPTISKGYYNDPEMTKEAFVAGWLKTGDIFYRDENFNFFFVERMKMMLKYRNHQVSPTEIENVIYGHGGVLLAAVTGVPHEECGDLPVACVVPRPGHTLTAREIKDLVKDNLTDTKQLRGGVIFMKELPLTVSNKIDRSKLKQMVLNMEKQ